MKLEYIVVTINRDKLDILILGWSRERGKFYPTITTLLELSYNAQKPTNNDNNYLFIIRRNTLHCEP